jgi:hypothetical protein
VGGISVHGLEDRQKVDMHGYWSALGGVVNLGHGTGIFRIVVERFFLFHMFLIFFMTSYFFLSYSFEPPLGLGHCTLKWG